MTRKIWMLLAIGAALLAIFVGVGGYLLSQSSFVEKSIPSLPQENLPIVSFGFSGASGPVRKGKSFDITISVVTGETLFVTDLDINYDAKVLMFEKIKPGNFFKSPIEFSKNVNVKNGKIFYALGSLSGSSGDGTVAIISFRGLTDSTKSGISLGDKTMAPLKGERQVKVILPTD